MMANELPRHFAAPALGMPRVPRTVSFALPTSEDLLEVAVPFTQSDAYATVSPVLPRIVTEAEARLQPTVRTGDKSFRKGADAPSKSSLVVFVVIGLFVGLCAFVAMSIALPESASAAPVAASTMKAPAPVKAAPVVAAHETTPAPAAAVITIKSETAADPSTASAKPAAARRRAPAAKRPASTKTISLPANPYGGP